MSAPDTPADRPAPQAYAGWAVCADDGTLVSPAYWTREIAEAALGLRRGWVPGNYDLVPCTVVPDTAPLPPDVVARALAQHEAEVKAAQWEHYKLGILHAAEFVQGAHRDHVVAAEIITHLLSGESLRSLKEQAKRAEVSFSWAEVERQCGLVRERATPRPAPTGEVG